MTDPHEARAHDPHRAEQSHRPASQTGEDKGRIKRPQQTDATMAEEDTPRGSEPEQRGAAGRRQ